GSGAARSFALWDYTGCREASRIHDGRAARLSGAKHAHIPLRPLLFPGSLTGGRTETAFRTSLRVLIGAVVRAWQGSPSDRCRHHRRTEGHTGAWDARDTSGYGSISSLAWTDP